MAYVTFMFEEGHDVAINCSNDEFYWNTRYCKNIFGKRPVMTQAPEPNNVIWENKSNSGGYNSCKIYGGLFIGALLLAFTSMCIFFMVRSSNITSSKYP
jgi:hypothetical protein